MASSGGARKMRERIESVVLFRFGFGLDFLVMSHGPDSCAALWSVFLFGHFSFPFTSKIKRRPDELRGRTGKTQAKWGMIECRWKLKQSVCKPPQ